MRHFYMLVALPIMLATNSLSAQSPGGVSGVELWYKTVPVSNDLQGPYLFKDFSGDNVRLRFYDEKGAAYGSEVMLSRYNVRTYNFNPSLNLAANERSKETLLKHTNLSQATIFGTFAPTVSFTEQLGLDMLLYALNGRPERGILFTKDKVIHRLGEAPLDYGEKEGDDLKYSLGDPEGSESKFRESAMRIATYYRSIRPNYSLWGERREAVITQGEAYNPKNVNYTTSFEESLFTNRQFQGFSPELIVYSRYLTPEERQRVESYLSIKYGLTLKSSYFASDNHLLWDIASNSRYKHRITGILRDNGSGLYQPLSTTTYEEGPFYSDILTGLNINDSYDNNNSYNLPSKFRMLVMGREQANVLANGKFLLWGDNDAPVTTKESAELPGLYVMQRVWLTRTNLDSVPFADRKTLWQGSSIKHTAVGFEDNLIPGTPDVSATAVTKTPLLDRDGYLSFVYRPMGIETILGFTQTAGSKTCDYGFAIDPNGDVFQVIGGKRQQVQIAKAFWLQTIHIYKYKDKVGLRIGQTRYPEYDLSIPEGAQMKPHYGFAGIGGSPSASGLYGLRTGGFYDTGNYIELGYMTNISDFASFRNGRTFLLIDPTGKGDFKHKNVRFIRNNGYDLVRGKIFFRNVFFDTDKTGGDAFTFAYVNGILAEINSTQPTCTGNKPNADGKIDIRIRAGVPCYSYTLTDSVSKQEPQKLIRSGIFCSDTQVLDKLPEGHYTLTISERGGHDLAGIAGGTPTTTYAQASLPSFTMESTWLTDEINGDYEVGIITPSSGGRIYYGVLVEGDKYYAIVSGQRKNLLGTIRRGDLLSFARNKSSLDILHNGKSVFSGQTELLHMLLPLHLRVNVLKGMIHLNNFVIEGSPVWSYSNGINITAVEGHRIVKKINLLSPCSPKAISATGDEQPTASEDIVVDDVLRVYVKDVSARVYTAEVNLQKAGAVSLLVYDATGRLVMKRELVSAIRTVTDIELNSPGIYLVKILTMEKEHTQKIIVK